MNAQNVQLFSAVVETIQLFEYSQEDGHQHGESRAVVLVPCPRVEVARGVVNDAECYANNNNWIMQDAELQSAS